MKFLKFFKKTEQKAQKARPGKFSEFFLHASEDKKVEILKEAARRANEEQRELLTKSPQT